MPAADVAVDVEGGVGREEAAQQVGVVRRDGGEVVADDPRRADVTRTGGGRCPGHSSPAPWPAWPWGRARWCGAARRPRRGRWRRGGGSRCPRRCARAPTNGASAGSVRSSTSKLMAHWRAKYSDGRSLRSGQKPPNDSACSSSRSSQNGAQPPEDSRNTTRSAGWRSSTPNVMSCAQASISSNECETACRIMRVEGPVGAERGHDDRAALVDPDRHIELLGRLPHDVVGAVGQRAAEAGVGPDEPGDEAELADGAAQLAAPPRPGPAAGAGRRRRAGGGRPRSSRPASRCRRAARVDRGRRVGDDGEVQPDASGRARPGRSPRCPCRPAAAPGPTRRGSASAKGRNVAGSSKVDPGRARLPSGTARISVSPTTTCS